MEERLNALVQQIKGLFIELSSIKPAKIQHQKGAKTVVAKNMHGRNI